MSRLRSFIKRLVGRPEVRIVYEPNESYDNSLLANSTALVTGAGRNIGRAITIEMLKQGARVVAVDVDETSLERLAASIPEADRGRLSTKTGSIAEQDSVDRICASLDESDVHIDTLVNNVGIHPDLNRTLKGEFADWRLGFETNVIGPYRLARAITDRMVARGATGNVIFLSSVNQWQVRGNPAYSASKAAVGMIVKELADELADKGIRINGIAPGAVIEEDREGRQIHLAHTPLHQIAIPPRYVARTAVYLASDYFSRHTTGSVVVLDAGLMARGFPFGNARKEPRTS